MLSDLEFAPQVHEIEIVRRFGERARYVGPVVFDHPLHLLSFSNRSGSNLLAEYLRSTGVFSGFNETLNFDTVNQLAGTMGVDSFPEYIRAMEARMLKEARITGFKANWMQLLMLYRLGISSMYPSIKVIHIVRRDLLDQAVSFSIANQTKQWMAAHKRVAEPQFNFEDIRSRLFGSALSRDAVRHICEMFSAPILEVTYEEMIADPRATLDSIFSFVGEHFGNWTQPQNTRFQKQGDETNEQFKKKFLDESRKRALA